MTALTPRRDYLAGQRRRIIGRAIAGSIAGAVPLPFVDDWIVGAVLGSGYRRIAAAHHIDIDDAAIKTLVFGTAAPPSIANIAIGGILMRLVGRSAKRMMVVLATVNRARSAARHFVTMTLFNHYCAKLHTGLAIDQATALALRDEIVRAIDQTPGALVVQPFRRGALSAARAAIRAPLTLADRATRGAVRRLLARGTDVANAETVDEVDRTIEAAIANQRGALARAVTAVELQLSSEGNPFLDLAIDNLDRRWRARTAAEAASPGWAPPAPQDPE